MTNEQIQYWQCVRAICCRQWGIPPWEFDAACKAEKVTAADIEKAVDLAKIESNNIEVLLDWLRPGTMAAIKHEAEERKMAASWQSFFPGGLPKPPESR